MPLTSPYQSQIYKRRKALFLSLYSSFLKNPQAKADLREEIEQKESDGDSPLDILIYLYECVGEVI